MNPKLIIGELYCLRLGPIHDLLLIYSGSEIDDRTMIPSVFLFFNIRNGWPIALNRFHLSGLEEVS